ncbi:MAG: hypothetical protein B6244_08055 [Candidatus Cloacimonetes bacterium 4572_55]|nr:MAG: hypothetical protein B6244_08055 [Candidatus Cloacimonetes bacterium 4572_55]
MKAKKERLRFNAQLIDELREEEMEDLLKNADVKIFDKGDVIIEEGGIGEDFFVILEGTISISKRASDNSYHVVGTRYAGEFFGEMALLEEKPRSARATALTQAALMVFNRELFYKIIHNHPNVFLEFIRAFSYRLRESNKHMIGKLELKNKELEKRVEERTFKLKEKNNQLARLNEKKNEILRICAHDLRHPITVIQGFTEILRETKIDDDEREDYFDEVIRHCIKMVNIINGLLDISAIESGNLVLNIQPTDMNELIQARVHFFELLASKKSIQIELDLAANAPELRIDQIKIGEVLDNLLNNALKYSHPETTVAVVSKIDNNEMIVMVRDQGQGLSKEDISLAFREFQRLSAQPTGNETSAGLGLAIVKRLVELHNGRVGVQSPGPYKGATFWFSLPIPEKP